MAFCARARAIARHGALLALVLLLAAPWEAAAAPRAPEADAADSRLAKRQAIPPPTPRLPKYDYSRAVHLSYLYFWGQRSGKLPYQRLAWRGDSCMDCKGPAGEDMSGGWYEATNALKFGGPFAHTHWMMGWALYAHEAALTGIGEVTEARDWVRIGAEYTLKAHVAKYKFIGMMGVGEGVDFLYQGPPEEWVSAMGFRRAGPKFSGYITPQHPSSEIIGAASAGMSLAYLTLRSTDAAFAARCLQSAKDLYDFATKYPGTYMAWGNKTAAFKSHAQYYPSTSYEDEIGIAAIFLYLATNEAAYLDRARQAWDFEDARFLRLAGAHPRGLQYFDWENKFQPLSHLLAVIDNNKTSKYAAEVKRNLDLWMPDCPKLYGNCKPNPVNPDPAMPDPPGYNRNCPCCFYTPRGLARGPNWGALGGASHAAFLALRHAKFLRTFDPADAYATKLANWAVTQANYILGDNKGKPGLKKPFSFLVGFGKGSWPQYPSHISSYNSFIDFPLRGQKLGIIQRDFVLQGVGKWNHKNQFIAYGALLGGPLPDDTVVDDHWNYTYTEPAQDYTGAFLAHAAGLVDLYGMKNVQTDCGLDLGWSHRNSSRATRRKYKATDKFHCGP
ncbi:Six-hairpin glycosidase-like protein [Hyaloraphidium curvatum]|nr:Six-hairpin glycosidase-like protein [Hyaloraphidium curvatum]